MVLLAPNPVMCKYRLAVGYPPIHAVHSFHLGFAMFLGFPVIRKEELPVLCINFSDLTDLQLVPVMIQAQAGLGEVSEGVHTLLVSGAAVARYGTDRNLLFVKYFLWDTGHHERLEDFPPFSFAERDGYLGQLIKQEAWLLSESQESLARIISSDAIPDEFNAVLLDGFQTLYRSQGMGASLAWKKSLVQLGFWPIQYGDDYQGHMDSASNEQSANLTRVEDF
jgi:hypothetical protein